MRPLDNRVPGEPLEGSTFLLNLIFVAIKTTLLPGLRYHLSLGTDPVLVARLGQTPNGTSQRPGLAQEYLHSLKHCFIGATVERVLDDAVKAYSLTFMAYTLI